MKIQWDAGFLRKLETLAVVSKKSFAGRMKGERRSPRKGSSVEFADYRNYVQGDDTRHVDWNAYARFEGLFLKLFMEEEDLRISFLLDRSRSMGFGGKFEAAAKVVAALGYVGLANLDRIEVVAFSSEGDRRQPWLHGRQQIHRLLSFLESLEPGGRTDLPDRVKEFAGRAGRPGLAVVVSDFLDPGGFETPLNLLKFHGFDVAVLQILAREEVDPPVGGDWRLKDSETGESVDLSLGPRAVRAYKARFDAFTSALDAFARGRDLTVLRAVADQDFEELVLKYFREAQLVA